MDRGSDGYRRIRLLLRFRSSRRKPVASKFLDRADAACQQVVHTNGIDLHALLPIPTHSEHDNGPYITAGLVIARNPRTGVQNVSINRIQVHGPDRMAILLLPRHLYAFQKAAEEPAMRSTWRSPSASIR